MKIEAADIAVFVDKNASDRGAKRGDRAYGEDFSEEKSSYMLERGLKSAAL